MIRNTIQTSSLTFIVLLAGSTWLFGQHESATFFRAFNLNGPELVIDGNTWEAGEHSDLKINAKAFENQSVALIPRTDASRAQMIRSSRWGQKIDITLTNVPDGTYQIFAYVWEDNASERFSILLNNRTVVPQYESGQAGKWKRLGPWRAEVTQGSFQMSSQGGTANFSGIEIWKGLGVVPDPIQSQFAMTPDPEQLAFFESKIRPLLANHCYECHSKQSDTPGGGLQLDSRPAILRGGSSEPVILPGDPENSLLFRAVSYKDPDLRMPPDGRLSTVEVSDLESWIRMKAPDPRLDDTVAERKAAHDIDWEKARNFWSLMPIQHTTLPQLSSVEWPNNIIDYFILEQLELKGLRPGADADRRTLIRRAALDLTGLMPEPEEIEDFVADPSPDAYAKVIDRLLDSPQYGERWGRHWLDVVRYSDSAGDNSDFPIPQMHKYRDWVIDAFNRDLPYDQFVREQLAGDLVGGSTENERIQRVIATGYVANARRFGSRVDDYPQHLTIEDTLDNLGRTFLATTINCARCHNHKFDPVTTEDYYALYGIFHSTRYPWPGIELEQRQRDLVVLAAREQVEEVENERRAKQLALDEEVKRLMIARDRATGAERVELEKQFKSAEKMSKEYSRQPLPFDTLYAVAESNVVEDVPVQVQGNPLKTGDIVHRRFLKMIHGEALPKSDTSSGRLQLADWIVDKKNPLTARVLANRIWSYHFKQGIVPTPNDFGRQGKPPSHPQLLDWLAKELMQTDWSIKRLHRTIMLSRTYQLSSRLENRALEIDPLNIYLSAYPRKRLDAESIRDQMLRVGKNLDLSRPGPHPFPHPSQWQFTQHNPFKAVYESNRRSVYLMTQRIQRHPYLAIFDGADPAVSTPARTASTTPLQALYLLNDKFVHQQADGFAMDIRKHHSDTAERVRFAWAKLFGREPSPDELREVALFLNEIQGQLNAQIEPSSQELEAEVWRSMARSLLRSNELIYVD